MSNQDKTLKCRDCGDEFIFTAGEQSFFEQKGFESPSRCTNCRKKKKTRFQEDKNHETSKSGQVYEIVCSSCAKKTQVNFKPRNSDGILCSDCFNKIKK